MDDIDLNFFSTEALERIGECLDRTVHVAFEDDVELLEVSDGQSASDFFEGEVLLRADALFARKLLTALGNLLGLAFVFKDGEVVAGGRSSVQSEDRYGSRRSCLVNFMPALVHHGAHLAAVLTYQDEVAHAERSGLNQNGRHVTAALIERSLDHSAFCVALGVRLQVEEFSFEKDLFEELVDVEALLG